MGYLSWATKKPRKPATPPATAMVAAATSSGGCINAVLHIFDFQRFNLCLHPQLDHHELITTSSLHGVEAPRNSLEAVQGVQKDIPMGIEMNITRRDTRLKLVQAPREDITSTSESSDSPARTPSLVARLMGLDVLPESTTPRSSVHTPRTAPPRKAASLSESPRRLSLQINNKENSIVREMESSRPSCSAINTKAKVGRLVSSSEEGESRSPGFYARQIMRQVKETVSRRSSSSFGVDITNNVSRRDEHLLTLSTKPRKPTKIEPGSKLNRLNTEHAKSESPPMAVKPPPKPADEEKKVKKKKNSPKSYDSSIKNKKDEQFVRHLLTNTKSKKTPLSSDLVYGSIPSLALQKQGSSSKAQPSKPIMTKSTTRNQAQLSRTPSQPRKPTEATHIPAIRKSKETNSMTEFQYISRILKCTGIDRDTPVTLARWFSTSHPLNPSIFHTLEGAHYVDHGSSFGSSNRRLIFNLVDEILAGLIKLYVMPELRIFGSLRQCGYNENKFMIYGFQLVKILCTRIRSIPSTDCQTLQDIDALVEKDMTRSTEGDLVVLEEEGDGIVSEIERDILDSLVHEVAVFCLGSRPGVGVRLEQGLRLRLR